MEVVGREMDWYDIKFLESSSNLKDAVKASVGRRPSTGIANDIAICIRQGRLFFEAAGRAPLEIQPLQIFYGVVSFSKAIVMARKVVAIDTLAQRHGISDSSKQSSRTDQLALKIGNGGTFQEFNDVLAPLGSVWYFDGRGFEREMKKPFDLAGVMPNKIITLKEILRRTPKLEELYERTFRESARSLRIDLHYWHDGPGGVELRIEDSKLFSGRQDLIDLVQKWRTRCPFLAGWCLKEASLDWGFSVLSFANYEKSDLAEFSSDVLIKDGAKYYLSQSALNSMTSQRLDFSNLLPALTGGITRDTQYAIEPYENVNFSEFSLEFLGSFLLSSLVRYRPQIWQHAISRSTTQQSPADDQSLALIEKFLALVLEDFPNLVVKSIEARN